MAYLFSWQQESGEFENWIISDTRRKAWGIFIEAAISLEELGKHLKRFLIVKNENGNQFYFRFYKPQVMRVFLSTCDAQQLREFFGPVSTFICEDENPEFALIFTYDIKLRLNNFPFYIWIK